jgi:hypothetical protein
LVDQVDSTTGGGGFMQLDLSGVELDALRHVLDRHLSDMYAEISHTDNPAFRAELREERAVLRAIREKLDRVPS